MSIAPSACKTASVALAPITDIQGREAFRAFDALLMKVQRGSPTRAKGAALSAAKRAYQAHLPVLQPAGQHMLDRVVQSLDSIRDRLRLPAGYSFSDNDYRDPRFREFRAGEFQLNESASLYINRDIPANEQDPAYSAEIRLFTKDVHVFVPAQMRSSRFGFGRDLAVFDSSVATHPRILRADAYENLVDAVVAAVQSHLDAIARGEPL